MSTTSRLYQAGDHACNQAMCHDLPETVENKSLMQNVLFSDEATFHMRGDVNRHNCRFWADEKLCKIQGGN